MGREEQLLVTSPSEHPFPQEQAYGTADFTFLLVSVSWGSAVLRTQGSRDLQLENVDLGMGRRSLTEEAMGEMGPV